MKIESNQSTTCSESKLKTEDRSYLKKIAEATFRGFETMIDPATGLPVDIAEVSGNSVLRLPPNREYSKTSPTNIGLGFLYLILARDHGFIDKEVAYQRVLQMLGVLEMLETYEKFHYNWYYLSGKSGRVPEVIHNRFVSSIDNGNLDLCLMASAGAFPATEVSKRIERLLHKRDYNFFFDKNPIQPHSGLINLGFDQAGKTHSSSDYSILNIEGRMTVLLAILKNNIPDSAWKKMARLVRYYETMSNKWIGVVAAWGGSLFETLFADEIIGGSCIAPRAFYRNAVQMIRIHRDKGKRLSKSGIWGFSNGEVPSEDRYEMAGVKEIAYNRFPGEFVTIYSSFLALRYFPKYVIENLQRIEQLNPNAFNPNYGFTDSIDPVSGVINKKILSLDKGMEALSIGNLMMRSEGKEIPVYLWKYFEQQGWKSRAKELLKGEEKHPSFKALWQPMKVERRLEKPCRLDLLSLGPKIVSFVEPGRAELTLASAKSEDGTETVELFYNVTARYSYSGAAFKFNGINTASYDAFSFQAKGCPQEGIPQTLKIELKHRGEFVQFEHAFLTDSWTEIRVPLPIGSQAIDEIAFVFENAAVGENKTGKIWVKGLTFI